MPKQTTTATLVLALFLLLAPVISWAVEPYTAPTGDLDGDGSIDVIDIQCEVLIFTQVVLDEPCESDAHCTGLFGESFICRAGFDAGTICLPACLEQSIALGVSGAPPCNDPEADDADCLGLVAKRVADLNCDGDITNVDFNFLVQIAMMKIGGPLSADYDADGKLNFCDDDSDGDGDPDETDCGILEPGINSLLEEVCDGADNDCDSLVDGDDDSILAPDCLLQTGVCAGSSAQPLRCQNGEWGECTVEDYQASSGAYEEAESLCDGLDNDCDGAADSADPELTIPGCEMQSGLCTGALKSASLCSGAGWQACGIPEYLANHPLYQLEESRCDELDNDCDGSIDEEWPTLGQECDGTDADVCAYGALACAPDGMGAFCDEFPDNLVEVCANEVDDDCDGAIDENTPESPCQAYQPPVLGARVAFLATRGYPVGSEELGLGYYQSDIWNVTDIDDTAAVHAQCHDVSSDTTTLTVITGDAGTVELYTSRDTVFADDAQVRLAAFVTDSFGRPVAGTGVTVDVDGPFGASQVSLGAAGAGMYAGTYTPEADSFETGGTETLTASAADISSAVREVVLAPLPSPASLQLDVGRTGMDLPLGPRLAGHNFTIPVTVNTGTQTLASLNFAIVYPAALVDYVQFQVTNGGLNPASVNNDAQAGTLSLATTRNVQTDPALLTGEIQVGTLTFKTEASAEQGADGEMSGQVVELLDTSGNNISTAAAFEVHDGQGQGVTGTVTAQEIEVRGMMGWIDDLSLVDLSATGLAAETGTVHTWLFDNQSASPQAAAPDSCDCGTPAVCNCAGAGVSVAGPGTSAVTFAAGGFERTLQIEAFQYAGAQLHIDNVSLHAIDGWPGIYQSSFYRVLAAVDGPGGQVELDMTRQLSISSSSPVSVSWDEDRYQITGYAPGSATVSALGAGGAVLAGTLVNVTDETVSPTSLTVLVPSLFETTRVTPSLVPAFPGISQVRVKLSSLFAADGQTAPVYTYLQCSDGHSHDISGSGQVNFAPQAGGNIVSVEAEVVTATGTGADTIIAELSPGGNPIATGQAVVEVSLPDAEGAFFSPSSALVALDAGDSAAVLKGLSTYADLSVTVDYTDGTSSDMTDDSRTFFEVVAADTLVHVCNHDDPEPACEPGRVISLETGTGEATIRASWPGLYSGDVEAFAVVEVVGHESLTLSTWEDFDPSQIEETVLSTLEGTGVYQSARLRLIETYTDGSTQTVTASGQTQFELTNEAGEPEAGVVAIQELTLVAVAPGIVNVQGITNGNASNVVPLMVEGQGIDDGDGKYHAELTDLSLAQPADLVGVRSGVIRNLSVTATFDDGTHVVAVANGNVAIAGLVEFEAGNSAVTNPADGPYATVAPATGVVTLSGNGLVRLVARIPADNDIGSLYQPGEPPQVTQANPLQLPTTHPGTRWLKCNCTPKTGDADLGAAGGLPVPIVVNPGETFPLAVRVNSGNQPLGAFSLEVYFDASQFEIPQPSADNLEVVIPADAAAINDPAPGVVKLTVVPAESTSLTGTTHVANINLRALNSKLPGPVFTQLSGTILELYAKCPDAGCPAINGDYGPAPRAIDAGVVSIDPPGNLAEGGDFNGDGQFGVADLQAVVNYVTAPDDPQFADYDLAAANIFPDLTAQGQPKIQAFDAYYGALVSVGLSHFVQFAYGPADGGGLQLSVEVRDGSAQPQPVTANLRVTFEVGRMSGASLAEFLVCDDGCSQSADTTGAPVAARHLYEAAHAGNGLYQSEIADWGDLPGGESVGVVVILQNLFPDGSDKGEPKVYLRTPFENIDSPFDPLEIIVPCGGPGDCADGYVCTDGLCQEEAGDGEQCTEDGQCGDDLHCDEALGQCVSDIPLGGTCAVASDCVEDSACVENLCGYALCELTGEVGATSPCPLHLVRGAQSYTPATMLEFELGYDPAVATPASLRVCGPTPAPLLCPNGNECDIFGDPSVYCHPELNECWQCIDYAVDDKTAVLSSGHAIVTCVQPPANCGEGLFKLVFWGVQSLPISPAWLDNGDISGTSLFLTVNFTIESDPGDAVVGIHPLEFIATDAKAKLLPASVATGGPDGHYILTAEAE